MLKARKSIACDTLEPNAASLTGKIQNTWVRILTEHYLLKIVFLYLFILVLSSIYKKLSTLIDLMAGHKILFRQFKNYALFTGNKCIPIFSFWILLCSLLIFLAIARSVLSARTFDVPLLRYRLSCMVRSIGTL